MIKISIKKDNDQFKKITIKGHANYSEYGSDIVCASVSSIVITSINAILKIEESVISYKQDEGFIEIKVNYYDKISNSLLENMIELLKELEIKYKKYIKIEEV